MHPDEAALLAAIHTDPHNLDGWLVLADWLDDDADLRGELLRLVFALTRAVDVPDRTAKEARMRQLIADGVRPCVPVLVNLIGMELVLLPPGTFRMGSPLDELDRHTDETPHVVTLTQPFYIARFPVTQAEYRAVTGQSPAAYRAEGVRADRVADLDTSRFPVESVTWDDASRFCAAMSALPAELAANRQYRLITEAEWEYVARAGTTTPFFTGESLPPDRANFDATTPYREGDPIGSKLSRPCPVGTYPPNAFGLCDLTGNVDEWCADRFDDYPAGPAIDPMVPLRGTEVGEWFERVLRGGNFSDPASTCRSAFRFRMTPSSTDSQTGFRVAMSVPSSM